MKIGCISIWLVISTLFTACGAEAIPTQAADPQVTIPQPTTVVTKTDLMTDTPTATNTWIPSSTPTIGPPPDLELKNVIIYPEHGDFDQVFQKYYLFGRVRNNTQSTIVISDDDMIFRFQFEVWEHNIDFEEFRHLKYSEEVTQGIDQWRIMNCILYPGDEGIVYYQTRSGGHQNDYLINETRTEYSGPLGIWYAYESFYYNEPDIPLNYHPGTENLVFTKENGELIIDYDIVDIPDLLDTNHIAQAYTWVIMYDKEGQIINVLQKRLATIPGFKFGKPFHIHGRTGSGGEKHEQFYPPNISNSLELTPEMIERTNHLEIINEFEENNMCHKYHFQQ
jgi:hypothetical protein